MLTENIYRSANVLIHEHGEDAGDTAGAYNKPLRQDDKGTTWLMQ